MEMDNHVWDFHGKSQRYGSLFLKQLFPLLFFCEFGWNRLGKQHHRVSNRGREGQWDEVKGIRVGFSQQENRFSFSVFIRF